MPSLASLFVSIQGDARPLNKTAAGVKATLTRLDQTKVEPKVTLPNVEPQITALQAKIGGLSRTSVKLGVDTHLADAEVNTLRRQLDTLTARRHSLPVELQDKASAEIAVVQRELAAAERRQTQIPLKLERVDAKIAAVRDALQKLERDRVDIPVAVNQRGLREQIGQIRTAISDGLRGGPDVERSGRDSGRRFSGALRSTLVPSLSAMATGVGAAFAGAGVIEFLNDSKVAASDLSETVSKSNNVFGQSAQAVFDWSRTSAQSYGLSQRAALAATAQFGDMFHQLGFTEQQSARTSQNLVKMAADLGSFHNVDPSDVLERIGASLRGEYD